jgi:EAL domain-containing protein (putative c-di-GMP-specific phosphodiesterase class I)
VTEGIMLSRDVRRIAQTIDDLRRNGVRIALDDFGTGYASLSQLRDMAVDFLKIDRSFARGLGGDEKAAAIIAAIVALAKAIDIPCVAEGIETQAQLDVIRTLGCTAIQGYLVAKPMPAEAVGEFIGNFGAVVARLHAGEATRAA